MSLIATYRSQKRSESFQLPLVQHVPSENHTPDQKTAHLSDLRSQVEQMQAELNKYLTAIMAEEKEAALSKAEEEAEGEEEGDL